MDFYTICERQKKTKKDETNIIELYPTFNVRKSSDFMIRAKSFYAIWDEEKGLWSKDESDVARIIDNDLYTRKKELEEKTSSIIEVKNMSSFSSRSWIEYKNYLNSMYDTFTPLDQKIIFQNNKTVKNDYASKKLQYSIEDSPCDSWDEIIGTLYLPEERQKIEWAIGSIITGDAKTLQKFIVLYGEAGSGKSTILNIIEKLFEGYYVPFEAKAITSSNNTFALEMFKNNPLVAIQHDGDLSRIDDNSKLNSIISHEKMVINVKHKSQYASQMNCFLFMATNKPVKITDAKSGIIRRLIDVTPSGQKIKIQRYDALLNKINFELGAIANHCLNVYRSMGKNYYNNYRAIEMQYRTDVFFNFVEEYYHVFKEEDGIGVSQAYTMYKEYCDDSMVEYKLPLYRFKEELKNYFKNFTERTRVDGKQLRSYYSGFLSDKFINKEGEKTIPYSLVMDEDISKLDTILAECPAQYASISEIPEKKWDDVNTVLKDLDTKKLHYVRLPENHIVIDFDLKDSSGKKSIEKNLEEASKWPSTYAEFSKSGAGIHLHYIYKGDVTKLSRVYSEGIEIKVFTGKATLRRKFKKCNNIPVNIISDGLPLKGEKMINFESVKNEKGIRTLIIKNLQKEYHPGTKPSIDFISKILSDAYENGVKYDVTDMRQKVLNFALNSSNQADYCIKAVQKMKWASDEPSITYEAYTDESLYFYDVEVFPNLFVVVWKKENGNKVKMINPKPKDIEPLLKLKLIGFNNRRYDNHILYARYIGYSNIELFNLSQKIINGSRNCMFGEAYNLSYTDVYDFSSKKQSLKKFEIDLNINHIELGLPWDQDVPEHLWEKVAEYCGNDVDATEATFHHRKQDYMARLILADLSGLTPNDTTQAHTSKIIFGNDPKPQEKFVYTDLSKEFPGYVFKNGKSTYKKEITGEGGYVYSEPGMYSDTAVLDIASMHPTSLVHMNMFGPYTNKFKELLDARLAIKHEDFEKAKTMLNGALAKYVTTEDAKALAYALKIVINIVYGLTSAKFENKFKDPRNKDNIVAKRGALFMINLKQAVQKKGFSVVHIKTDSIKIPNATKEIISFVMDFGKRYGYVFEHEETYSKFCLVNDAVYIAKTKKNEWEAVGTQFSQPYVFKTLFSHEKIEFSDMIETKSVTSLLYLDFNENLPEGEHDYHFVGKVGAFCPIKDGCGGGVLYREKDGKYYAVTGTKGYRWLEAEMVREMKREEDINKDYYNVLVNKAVENISKYGDFEWFVSDKVLDKKDDEPIGFDEVPFCPETNNKNETCEGETECGHPCILKNKGVI